MLYPVLALALALLVSAVSPNSAKLLKIGSFNTGLIPPRDSVHYWDGIVEYLPRDLDVMVLQEVWDTNQQAQLAELFEQDYPYHWSTGSLPGPDVRCQNSARATENVNEFGGCLSTNGIETIGWNTIGPCLHILDRWLQEDEDCAVCTLAQFVNGTVADMLSCIAGPGQKRYAYGGSYGMVVLSKRPIRNARIAETLRSFVLRRGVATFCVDGISFGMAHYDFEYAIPLPQAGQEAFSGVMLRERPNVILGDLNSGPNHQPAGYRKLIEAGYFDADPHLNTYCPEPERFPSACTVNGEQGNPPIKTRIAVDHILLDVSNASRVDWQATEVYSLNTFPGRPVADHVGIQIKALVQRRGVDPLCTKQRNNNAPVYTLL